MSAAVQAGETVAHLGRYELLSDLGQGARGVVQLREICHDVRA